HAIPLAARPRMPGAISVLLATGKIELCGLLDETPRSKTSQTCQTRIPDAIHCFGDGPAKKAQQRAMQNK
ncbi:hypothetical protein THAOC_10542, partial [Thalassiosira oceanica]